MESGLAVSSVNTSCDCFAFEFPGSFFEALEAADRSLALGSPAACRDTWRGSWYSPCLEAKLNSSCLRQMTIFIFKALKEK